jgi:hypothetical protein
MKNVSGLSLRIAAVATVLAVGAPAFAEISANIEFDNTYLSNQKVNGVTTLKRGLEQSGRVELNAFGKFGPDTFVAGKASFLAKKDGTAAVDDMWFQLGNKTFDVKMGRFEAFNLFPTPGDVLLSHAGTVYQANTLRGRMSTSNNYGQGMFHAAGTFKSASGFALELGAVEFKQTEDVAPATTDKPKGLRPVVSYTTGALTVAAGIEAIRYSNANTETGFGALVSYAFDAVTLNGSVALAKDSTGTAAVSANKLQTLGISASAKMGLAGGVYFAKNETGNGAPGAEDGKVTTVYASYTQPLFDFKGATWSLGVNSSTVGGAYKLTNSDEKGMRLRFNYTF